MVHQLFSLIAVIACLLRVVSAFVLNGKTNVAIYWGQGPFQDRLLTTCKNPNVDVVIIGFVNVFPDQGPGGYPGTNFGNACGGSTYKNAGGKQTALLSSCPDIGPDIIACQNTYKKKVLLSLGGGYPTNYFIGSDTSAVNFANFLWGAFGPVTKQWTASHGPRPFGNAVVDGFDFDIESQLDSPPKYNGQVVKDYMTRGYVKMIQTFRQKLYPTDTSKRYFISGSPQCVVPDAHFANAVQTAWFDFLFVQFYNTPICSARAGVNYIEGASSIDITYSKWSKINFFNPNAKIFIGLPASTSASNSYDYYLPPKEADLLIRKYYSDSKFGGLMLWEATYAANNVVCGKNYPTWIKKLLQAVQSGRVLNTTTNDCPNPKIPCGSCPANAVSQDGRCGANFGTTCAGSKFGPCCGPEGYCSSTYKACSSGCDSQYANCTAAAAVQPAKMKRGPSDTDATASTGLFSNNTETLESAGPVVSTTSLEATSHDLDITTPAVLNAQSSSSISSDTIPTSTTAATISETNSGTSGTSASSSSVSSTISDAAGSPSTASANATTSEETNATTISSGSLSSTAAYVERLGNALSLDPKSAFTTSSVQNQITSTAAVTDAVPPLAANVTSTSQVSSSDVPIDASPAPPTEATSDAAMEDSPSTPKIAVAVTTALNTTTPTIIKSTRVVTIFSTVFQTITEDASTRIVSTLLPIATSTVVLTKTVTEEFTINEQVLDQIPANTMASDAPSPTTAETDSTSTITVKKTSVIYTTVTVPGDPTTDAAALTATELATTTIVPMQLNPDESLYNPHASSDSSSSDSGPRTITTRIPIATRTLNLTVIVTPSFTSTTTLKSTKTVVQTITVEPNAFFAADGKGSSGGAGAFIDKAKVKSNGTAAAIITVSTSDKTSSTGAGGRISPRDGVVGRTAVAVMLVGVFMLFL